MSVQGNLDFMATRAGLAEELVIFDRFRLKRQLGRGGMGVVWLAWDMKLEREVALKFMPDMVATDAAAVNDLRKETRNGMRLSHQGAVTMLDLAEQDESAAIVMEFVDGPNLSDLRLKQPNQVFETASLEKWVFQVLDVLEHAHKDVGIIHRDLKPANLMVNQADHLKVADFGIASCMRDSVSRISVKANASSGTLVYMSPQQLLGDSPCPADDIYALGSTLYELLTGKPPFHSGDIAMQVQSKVPPRISERRAEFGIAGDPVPEAWETVIAACLEKSPTNRPIDIDAVRQGLRGQKFRRGSGQLKTRTSHRSAGKQSSLPWVAAAAAVVLGVPAWYFGVHAPAAAKEAERVRLEREKQEADATKKIEADAKLDAFRKRLSDLRNADETASSAKERRQEWDKLHNELTAFSYPWDDSAAQVLASVKTARQAAQEAEATEETAYADALKTWRARIAALKTKCDDPKLGATPKTNEWDKALAEWPAATFASDAYGSAHAELRQEIVANQLVWKQKALQETPAEPPGLAKVFEGSAAASWTDAQKTKQIERVQKSLAAADHYKGKIDSAYGAELHTAILAFQKANDLPVTGVLDDNTQDRLKVEKTPPTIASSGSSGKGSSGSGKGSSGSGKSSGGGRSGNSGAADWMKWIPNGGPRPPGFRPF